MELRAGVSVDDTVVREFAMRHGIVRLALFGSVLRADFGPGSDVDVLVEFAEGRTPGLVRLAAMELEFEDAIGREVDLRTREDLSPRFRDAVVAGSLVLVDR